MRARLRSPSIAARRPRVCRHGAQAHVGAFRRGGRVESPRETAMVGRGTTILSLAWFAFALPQARAAADDPAFKLTLGAYDFSDHSRGVDTNLRNTSQWGNAWIGFFRLPEQQVSQWRTGWDRSFGSAVRITPSAQLAS